MYKCNESGCNCTCAMRVDVNVHVQWEWSAMRVFYLDSRTNKRLDQHSHLDSVDMGGGVGIWFSRPALTTACCAIDFNEDMDSEFCN